MGVGLALSCIIFLTSFAFAGEVNYLYDDNGRLRAVIDSQSNETIYNYDEVGNLLSITQRTVTGAIAITDFDPREGVEGTEVTVYGKGFSTTPSDNIVKFNGVQATVISSTATKIITSAPSGATTGKITVTNSNGTATSLDDFIMSLPVTNITVSPETAIMLSGSPKQFKAYADSVETKKVKWSIEGIEGGNFTYGTITAGGLYIAPYDYFNEVTITATSLIDPAKSGNAKVNFASAMLSLPVSVAIEVIPDETVLTSKAVSIQWPTVSDAITVSAPVSVKICSILPVRVVGSSTNYYSTVQAAYDASLDGDTIQSQAVELTENVSVHQSKSIIFEGGYDCNYTNVIGYTQVKGMMTVNSGTAKVGNFILKE